MYEQVNEALLREQEKRRRLQKEMMQPSSYDPYRQVSGRSVPYSPIQGLSSIAKALIQRSALDKSDERTEALKKQYGEERQDAFGQFGDQYYGKEETLDQADMTTPEREGAVAEDRVGAAMFAMQDPYLKDTGIGRAIMPAKERGSFSTYVDYTDPETGVTRKASFNSRAPTGSQLTELDGTPINTSGLSTKDISLVAKGAAKKQYATDIAAREAEKVIQKPTAEIRLEAEKYKMGSLNETVDKAIEQTEGFMATGFGSQLTGWIGDTPASDLEATLSTIKANAGFDRLQQMRDNSPTGGALGAISKIEIELLMDSYAALQQKQSDSQLVENLKRFKRQYRSTWKNMNEAYKKDYDEYYFDPEEGADNGATSRQKLLDKY